MKKYNKKVVIKKRLNKIYNSIHLKKNFNNLKKILAQ